MFGRIWSSVGFVTPYSTVYVKNLACRGFEEMDLRANGQAGPIGVECS